jgi:signal transduction histidine kinase/ligand-binding sensor domain-containing protein
MGLHGSGFLLAGVLSIFLIQPAVIVKGWAEEIDEHEKKPNQYSSMVWTVESGLPDNVINDILQTRDGFLWIATDNGLSRFDGFTFDTIDRKTHPALQSSRISTLLEDQSGNLWFGTFGGGLYTVKKDTLLRFSDKEGLPSNYVSSLAEDSKGTVWVGTDGEGLGMVLSDTVVTVPASAGVARNIFSLAYTQDDVLWIGTQDGIFQHRDSVFTEYPSNDKLPETYVLDLFCDDEGIMWAATSSGVTSIREGVAEQVKLTDAPVHVKSVTKDENGHIWIAGVGFGVYRISEKSTEKYSHNDPAAVLDINVVYNDREGNIWLGTVNSGLIQLRDEVVTTFSVSEGLPHELVHSVSEGKPGELWIGGAGGLTRLAGSNATTYEPGPSAAEKHVFSVFAEKDGDIWAGTRTNRLMKLVDGKLTDAGLPDRVNSVVWVVYSDQSGTVWAGTNNGLYRLRNGEIERFTANVDELTNNDVRSITQSKDGTIWIGTSFGLNAYKNGKFTHYTHEAGLSDLIIVSLHADEEGDIWAGTYGGLHRIRNGIPGVITMEHGLPYDMISTILEDDSGYLWLGGKSGISRINKAEVNAFMDGHISSVSARLFGRAEGMKNENVRMSLQPSGWRAEDGTLWFATDNGVAMIDPSSVRKNMEPPPVQILNARVDGESGDVFRPAEQLILPTLHNQVEIAYAAPTFKRPGEVTFRYMLDGLHSDWVDAGNRRSAYFSRIPPGKYTFRVIAANEDGIWNETGVSLPVYVHPPFWMTWWFITLSVVLFLTIGPVIYYRRVSALERMQMQQQEFTMKLIDSQEKERMRIAGELHDSLGQNIIVIKNRALMATQEGAGNSVIAEQLDEISRTASETLEEMRKISYNLRPFNLERFGLTRSISRAVEDVIESTNIRFTQKIDPVDNILKPEAEIHIFRIVQEAINNILKHSKAKNASVTVRKMAGSVQLTIRDDGTGFVIVSDAKQNGIGLENLRQRAGLVGGTLTIHSRPGNGTTLNLVVPVSEEDQ